MTANQFRACLQVVDEYVRTAASAVFSGLDRLTFKMLVETLRSEDPEAVKTAIDQLAKEKRPVAIAPLYVVSMMHPHPWVRQQAKNGLKALIADDELAKLTADKDVQESVRILIGKYGHYKK